MPTNAEIKFLFSFKILIPCQCCRHWDSVVRGGRISCPHPRNCAPVRKRYQQKKKVTCPPNFLRICIRPDQTRSSPAIFYPRHTVALPMETYEVRRLSNLSLANQSRTLKQILKFVNYLFVRSYILL